MFALERASVAGPGDRLAGADLDGAPGGNRRHRRRRRQRPARHSPSSPAVTRAASGRVLLFGTPVRPLPPSPRRFVSQGVARIPEDRHAVGVVGDLAIWENAILERLGDPAIALAGLRRSRALAFAGEVVAAFDVRGEGVARTRLLSGGNMQKLILGRGASPATGPRFIVASQPTRGLDDGAIAEVHSRLLAARDAGAGILLISEDLDEVLALADRVAAVYRGRLTRLFPVEEIDAVRIGLLMAGHWEDADAA